MTQVLAAPGTYSLLEARPIGLYEDMTKWGRTEKEKWFSEQIVQRSYKDEVVTKILALESRFDLIRYGALTLNPDLYPLYLLRSKNPAAGKKTILITGGVHGYETSGVHGALEFLRAWAPEYAHRFNFVCVPCLSPWAYETINRWNAEAIDPNRSFYEDTPAEESRLFLEAMASYGVKPFAHFDLHETTDTDNTVFRPALEQRDGIVIEFSEIPDGFYVVGDTEKPQRDFQKAVVDAVRVVTHIAAPDESGKIIGVPIEQEGVINYPLKKLSLCAGFSAAEYTTTTEVYPDSPRVTAATCVVAQVAAIKGGLDYLIRSAKVEAYE